MLVNFQRQIWIQREIMRIGQDRFPPQYWSSLENAMHTCKQNFSILIQDPNKDKSLAGFILVCPPSFKSANDYNLHKAASYLCDSYEMAFVAVDAAHEGKGLARKMLTSVVESLRSHKVSCWLHVDTVNFRAKGLYESFGFTECARIPDPFGSDGSLMALIESGGNTHSKIRPALLNACPCETKQAFRGGIFTPPLLTSR
jgi:ribosomal protein S18 acetylase RimI-like enzyme